MKNPILQDNKSIGDLIDKSGDALIVTDADLEYPGPRILSVNQSFLDDSGYSANEILGKSPRILQGEKTDKDTLKRLKSLLKAGLPFHGTLVNYNKAGEEYVVNLTVTPVKDKFGRISNFISLQRNVTKEIKIFQKFQEAESLIAASLKVIDAGFIFLKEDGGIYRSNNIWDNFISPIWFSCEGKKNNLYDLNPSSCDSLVSAVKKIQNFFKSESESSHFELDLEDRNTNVQYIFKCRIQKVKIENFNGAVLAIQNVTQERESERKTKLLNLELEKRVEQRTHDLELQAAAMDSNMEGQAVMRDGKYIYMNPSHAEMYGFTAAELMGKSWEILYDDEVVESIREECFAEIASNGKWRGELKGRKKQGGHFDVEVNLRLRSNNDLICTCRDISEQKAAQRKLARQNVLLRGIAEMDSSLLLVSSDPISFFQNFLRLILNYSRSNTGFLAVLNEANTTIPYQLVTWQSKSEVGDHWIEVAGLSSKYSAIHRFFEKTAAKFRQTPESIVIETQGDNCSTLNKLIFNGEQAVKEFMVIPILDAGRAIGLLGVARRSERYNSQLIDELEPAVNSYRSIVMAYQSEQLRKVAVQKEKQKAMELANANHQLAKANKMKDEFLASMSHELRTPISGILNITETFLEGVIGAVNPTQEKYLKILDESGKHLLSLINDILDLAKIKSGKMLLKIEQASINQLLESSVRLVKESATLKRQTLTVDLLEKDLVTKLDRRRIIQVIVNLLSNAIKFSPKGAEIQLKVSLDFEFEMVQFEVIDSGIGISEEKITHIFEPFVQLDASLDRQYEGTGLGLALVKRIVTQHGGDLNVESKIGVGSRFVFTVPYQLEDISQSEAFETNNIVHQREKASGNQNDGCFRVLIVDDNYMNIIPIADYLKSKGQIVVSASSGQEALSILKNQNFDIILMDVQMPGMSGIDVITAIRADELITGRRTPIVALTALAMDADRQMCLSSGADGFLSKPIELSKLNRVINDVCNGVGI